MCRDKIMQIVSKMCTNECNSCRGLDSSDLAIKLLKMANVPTAADIQEIPLQENLQVEILFLMPNDNNYYGLFAGIGNDKKFHFELKIVGELKGDEFDFYDDDITLDINHFVEKSSSASNNKKNTNKNLAGATKMKFIRIDKMGTWKGNNHISSFATYDGTYDNNLDNENTYGYMENGISCYRVDNNINEGIEDLYNYWNNVAMWCTAEEYKSFQVTIFEGEKVGIGSDYEDIATCNKTLKEINAYDFMSKLFTYKEQFEAFQEEWDDEEQLTQEQYDVALKKLI